jgi:hypothetical protein
MISIILKGKFSRKIYVFWPHHELQHIIVHTRPKSQFRYYIKLQFHSACSMQLQRSRVYPSDYISGHSERNSFTYATFANESFTQKSGAPQN